MDRAGIYVRISRDPDGERAGVERQRAQCVELAEARGLGVVDIYEDNDVSAWWGSPRPEFERMMADAAAGRFQVVVVWASDRLYRRLTDLVRITAELAPHAGIVTVMGGEVDLSTAEGIMRAQIMGSVAEFESRRKGERLRARAEQRACTEGRQTAGVRPYGWAWADPCPGGAGCDHVRRCELGQVRRPRVGSRRGLVPHPVEGPLIAEAITRVSHGASLRSTARWLAAQGLVEINPGSVATVVRNPRHAGLVRLRGQVVGEAADGLRLVDREVWARAESILSDTARRTSPGRPVATPLGGGLLRCGKCAGPMSASMATISGPTPSKVPVYTCRTHHLSRRRALLDGPILDQVGAWLVEHGAALLAAAAPAGDAAADAARADLLAAEQRLADLQQAVADGVLPVADYGQIAGTVRDRIDQATSTLVTSTRRTALAEVMADPDGPAVAYARLRADAEQGEVEALRALLRVVTTEVVCLPPARTHRPTTSDVRLTFADGTTWGRDPYSRPVTRHPNAQARREELVTRLAAGGVDLGALADAWGVDRATLWRDRVTLRSLGRIP